jgi:hypothetical protein
MTSGLLKGHGARISYIHIMNHDALSRKVRSASLLLIFSPTGIRRGSYYAASASTSASTSSTVLRALLVSIITVLKTLLIPPP